MATIVDSANVSPGARRGGPQLFGWRLLTRIPRLPLWLVRTYQIVFVASVLAAIIGLVVFAVPEERERQAAHEALYSVGLDAVAWGEGRMIVDPLNPAAEAAGIRPGDTLLAIDGIAIDGEWLIDGPRLAGPDGSIARLTVQRGDAPPEIVEIERSANYIANIHAGSVLKYPVREWYTFWINTIYQLFLMAVAAILVVKHPRQPVIAILAMAWSFPQVPLEAMGAPGWLETLSMAVMFSCVPLGITLFPDGRLVSRWNWAVIAFVPVFIAAYLIALGTPGYRLIYYPMVMIMFALIGITVVTRYRRTPPGEARQQLKFFTLGLVILSICMIAMGLGGALVESREGVMYAWRVVFGATMVAIGFTALGIGILVSLLRYRLYDADRTISRSFSIGALTLALVAIFAASEKIIEVLGEEWFGEDLGALAGGLGAGVAALLIVPIHKRLDHWAEARFQNRLTRLRDEYSLLVADLRETLPPGKLAESALEQVLPVMRIDHGAVMMRQEPIALRGMAREQLDDWRAVREPPESPGLYTEMTDPVLPTRLSLEAPGHGRIGWLLLGPRPDGSTVGKDEREALEAIADPLARALQVSWEREARQIEQRAVMEAVQHRLTGLETELAQLRSESARAQFGSG